MEQYRRIGLHCVAHVAGPCAPVLATATATATAAQTPDNHALDVWPRVPPALGAVAGGAAVAAPGAPDTVEAAVQMAGSLKQRVRGGCAEGGGVGTQTQGGML